MSSTFKYHKHAATNRLKRTKRESRVVDVMWVDHNESVIACSLSGTTLTGIKKPKSRGKASFSTSNLLS
jgi:hypothetical protein